MTNNIFNAVLRNADRSAAAVGEGFCPLCNQRLDAKSEFLDLQEDSEEFAGTDAKGYCARCDLIYRTGRHAGFDWVAMSDMTRDCGACAEPHLFRTLRLEKP